MKKSTILTIAIVALLLTIASIYFWKTRTYELKTYSNEEIGISFKYPGNYDLTDDINSFISLCDDCDTQGENVEIALHPNSKSAKEGGLQFETIFATLKNNKILEFGVGFENKEQALYQDFQKMIQTIKFL